MYLGYLLADRKPVEIRHIDIAAGEADDDVGMRLELDVEALMIIQSASKYILWEWGWIKNR